MIPVTKDFESPPTGLVSPKAQAAFEKLLLEKHGHQFNATIYAHKTVKESLKKLYHDKCGDCESKTSHGATMQVEHYRPKGGIQEDPEHGGYYWTAYEWSNLLWSCVKCNRNKSNRFAVDGERLTDSNSPSNVLRADSQTALNECPRLLNPEIDTPDDFLTFTPNGHVISRNDNARALYTPSSAVVWIVRN